MAVPPNVMTVLSDQLSRFTGPLGDAWLFPGEGGNLASLRTSDRIWDHARRAAGRPDLRIHEFRHAGLACGGYGRLNGRTHAAGRSQERRCRPPQPTCHRGPRPGARRRTRSPRQRRRRPDVVPLRLTKDGRRSQLVVDAPSEMAPDQAQQERGPCTKEFSLVSRVASSGHPEVFRPKSENSPTVWLVLLAGR